MVNVPRRASLRSWLLAAAVVALLGYGVAVAALSSGSVDPRSELEAAFRELLSTPLTLQGLAKAAQDFWAIIGPGGKLHPAAFLEHKGHLYVEGALILVITVLVLQGAFKPKAPVLDQLTDKEVDQLCREWKPEPLASPLPPTELARPRLVTQYDGKYAVADGVRALNLASMDFLALCNKPQQLEVATETINKYGVGSCGPRGFYGTIDVHLQLEEQLAQFLGTDQAIIYSYDVATITSIIPAFANRKDTIVVDECCSWPIQQGVFLSRAAVHTFKHNDMEDLERVLQAVERADRKARKPLNRRLLVVEGVYSNTGELAPLQALYTLKEKFRYRLVVDESLSFGVMGATGRGAAEHWGLAPSQVDIMCASMGNALGSVGGFCVGTEEIVEHQRLSGSGYCFSASLPPYLATAASVSLSTLARQGPELMARVQHAAVAMRRAVAGIPGLSLVGPSDAITPVIHLRLSKLPPGGGTARSDLDRALHRIADLCLQGGLLVSPAVYSELERPLPPPSVRLYVNAELTDADIALTATVLARAAKQVLG